MQRFAATGLSLMALLASGRTDAGSAGDALTAFGLVGSWSIDCAKDLNHEFGSRLTFSAAPFGNSKLIETLNYPVHRAQIESEVRSAIRVTMDKIKIILIPTKIETFWFADPAVNPQLDRRAQQTVYERIGDKIRAEDSRLMDGSVIFTENGRQKADGSEAPLLEKCLD